MAETSDNNYVIGGHSGLLSGVSSQSSLVIKLNQSLGVVWTKAWTLNGAYLPIQHIQALPSGSIFFLGENNFNVNIGINLFLTDYLGDYSLALKYSVTNSNLVLRDTAVSAVNEDLVMVGDITISNQSIEGFVMRVSVAGAVQWARSF